MLSKYTAELTAVPLAAAAAHRYVGPHIKYHDDGSGERDSGVAQMQGTPGPVVRSLAAADRGH
jgi:hypothetical protein